MRIEEEEQQVARREKLNQWALSALSIPLEAKVAAQSFTDLSHLVQRAIGSAEAETVNKVMADYIAENREADHEANKRQDKIRFAERVEDSRAQGHGGLAKRLITPSN